MRDSGINKAVFHWFTGPFETLNGILDCGYFISATIAAEYSKELQEVIKHAAIENILLETDTPVKYKGIESAPCDVVRVLELVAKLKDLDKEIVAEKTTENAKRVFRLEF